MCVRLIKFQRRIRTGTEATCNRGITVSGSNQLTGSCARFILAPGTAHRIPCKLLIIKKTLRSKSSSAFTLRHSRLMKFYCRHCDKVALGQPYRVTSEENGETLLDMTVCRSCYEQACALGLHSEAVRSEPELRKPRRPTEYSRAGANG